jgi:hypothetical protein
MPSYTTKETAAELRKHLRTTWPTVKFSVRCARGTGSAWIGVSWIDGPTESQAQGEWSQFQSAQFNGMTDSYDQLDARLVCTNPTELPELRHYHCDGINGARGFSDAAVRATVCQLLAENPVLTAAFDVEAIDVDTLTYNTLHRSAAMLTINPDTWLSYLGEPLPGALDDLGRAIYCALAITDHYRHTGTAHR